MKKYFYIFPIIFILAPVFVLAGGGGNFGSGNVAVPPPPGTINDITANDVVIMIKTFSNWLGGIVLIGATLTMIIAAAIYLTAGGNEKKTQVAKKMIVYTIVAVIVVSLAYGIVSLITSLITGLRGR